MDINNLFVPIVKEEKYHFKFKLLCDNVIFDNERNIIQKWANDFRDRDNKIVTEFQTTFHSSFWEFYLHEVFRCIGFSILEKYDRPDFFIIKPQKLYIEAVVSNIRESGRKEQTRDMHDITSQFIPPYLLGDEFTSFLNESIIRHSNALHKKLMKYKSNYSKCDWVDNNEPYLIAMSAYDQVNYGKEYIYSMLALLFGLYFVPGVIKDRYIIKNEIEKNNGSKIKLHLFSLPEFRDVSAIIFSCTVTIGKLTSLAISEGIDSENNVYNLKRDHLDDKVEYKIQNISEFSPEKLTDGLFVFHNPNAKNPLDRKLFEYEGIQQFFYDEGVLKFSGESQPLMSRLSVSKNLSAKFGEYLQINLATYNRLPENELITLFNKMF